ncbi:biopolymer transporter ExbD [Pseudomethylobacillus aquaticus]|uniref:Biopolymer transporter ExbD n=1 Tax=Pseudomethylobacillus aquaticus TaxID=2676064 RepID=A0A3N0V6Q5_9PROT|nr:biopolymer transporter ExbD [Pseudomethylobacillus aquaticus]ROH88476.1 biopolymer transporter ExbD [Pseudomethylobacillus aquaticus]
MSFLNPNGDAHGQPMAEINTTPLVDVMLVLLVIFIITAPLLTHAVKIDLPQASSQPLPDKPEVISIAIDEAGKLYWNDVPLVEGELKVKLQQAAQIEPQPELHLRADKNTRYQLLAGIMADAQTVGITKLGFVSTPE